jgi:peptidyl-dipeptidase A
MTPASAFIRHFESRYVPLSQEAALAAFDAMISGRPEDYQRAADLEVRLKKILSDRKDFARLEAMRSEKTEKDPLLERQLDILHDTYKKNQIDPELLERMVNLQSKIERTFNTFRASVGGLTMTDNEIEASLRNGTDSKTCESAWKASKVVGRQVAGDVLTLVGLRNQGARSLGFPDFRNMQLVLGEQDPQKIDSLFDELDNLSGPIFHRVKGEADRILSRKFGVGTSDLRPWHYGNRFFQEAPRISDLDFDRYYDGKDLVSIARSFYGGIGLQVDDVITRSDLFEKPGKYQHACCIDIDREGDVRVVCNVKPDARWMGTLLHEYGHAAYTKYTDPKLPWILRDAAHTFTTEAIAMLFGRLASDPGWMGQAAVIPDDEVQRISAESRKIQQLEQLVFCRWTQVVVRFEKALYENPDQDLDRLWWDLVEHYQELRRPEDRHEPDWASKIHLASAPVYYHNYMLGEILASQLVRSIDRLGSGSKGPGEEMSSEKPKGRKVPGLTAGPSFVGRPEIGRFLMDKVFAPGMKFHPDEMIQKATGEPLTPAHYAAQFVLE